jgi:hypothetical protein
LMRRACLSDSGRFAPQNLRKGRHVDIAA